MLMPRLTWLPLTCRPSISMCHRSAAVLMWRSPSLRSTSMRRPPPFPWTFRATKSWCLRWTWKCRLLTSGCRVSGVNTSVVGVTVAYRTLEALLGVLWSVYFQMVFGPGFGLRWCQSSSALHIPLTYPFVFRGEPINKYRVVPLESTRYMRLQIRFLHDLRKETELLLSYYIRLFESKRTATMHWDSSTTV